MKKNIMFIIGNMKTGGAEHVIYNLCNTLKEQYNITLVVRTIKDADYVPDVNIVEIPELNNCKKLLIGLYKLKKLKKQLDIHTSISFLLKYNIYNYLSKYKEKVIISVRNNITENKKLNKKTYSKKNLFLFKRIINKVDLIVNVSASTMDDMIHNFKAKREKNIVIPNFCDTEYINSVREEELPEIHRDLFHKDVILSSGRYAYQKGQWHLIRAFKKVVQNNPNAVLVLTGRGPLKEYYMTLVEQLELQNHIYILDYVGNVYRYMYHSKIYLLNSFYEGMPNVILEAMACDLPIIATDSVGGTKEILEPSADQRDRVTEVTEASYGILIPTCDRIMYEAGVPLTKEEENIAIAIDKMLQNKALCQKYREASKTRVLDFRREIIIEKWKNIL